MPAQPTARLDPRFSSDGAEALPWPTASDRLAAAPLYWLTTVRADGRPHVTPLVGLWTDDTFVFCTGPDEQKRRNLATSPGLCVTVGDNTWDAGLDVVVEGDAVQLRGRDALSPLAAAYLAKYGDDWAFEATEEGFGEGDDHADVFVVRPHKVLAFAKSPHGQTTFSF
ncbi:pyridoxamine 5'-phosphate oxidase family protein [Nocardioides sp. Bht2]|uniref:pyridoxamine 5'-phosphate oxidase family protein n=1 Tax=Nocardioides sp. Bht2 TaxID=3392297 RepID=UPI0039B47BCA